MARKTRLTTTDVPAHLRGAISPERWAEILRADQRNSRRAKLTRDRREQRHGRR